VERFRKFLERGPSRAALRAHGSLTIHDAANKMIRGRLKRVLRDGRAITSNSPDEAIHALRIQCKRLRYLFEFFRPVYGRRLKPFIATQKDLQDVLGDFQDACVATERLRAFGDRVPVRARNRRLLMALGQLISSQRALANRQRSQFRKAWKRFDHKTLRRRLKDALSV
jgi:CHAD domain-containing protein